MTATIAAMAMAPPDRRVPEVNFGAGWGLTESPDDLMIKLILGRRF